MAFLAVLPSLVLSIEGFWDPTTICLSVAAIELVASLLAALGPAVIALYLLWPDHRLDAAGFGRREPGFIAGYGALGAVCCFLAVLTVGLVVSMVLLAL